MPFKNTETLLKKAIRGRYAVGSFAVDDLNTLRAIIKGLNETNSPGIIALSGASLNFLGTDMLEEFKRLIDTEAKVPVALHLDHSSSVELCKKCVDLGFSSVMLDVSEDSYEENVRKTREVVRYAHSHGVYVESELDPKIGRFSRGKYTDPQQAMKFIRETGIDALSIDIGNASGAYQFEEGHLQELDTATLDQLTAMMPAFPLVLHGASLVSPEAVNEVNEFGGKLTVSSSLSEEDVKKAIAEGIAKIDIATDIRIALIGALRRSLCERPSVIDIKVHLEQALKAVKDTVIRDVELLGSAGRAEDF